MGQLVNGLKRCPFVTKQLRVKVIKTICWQPFCRSVSNCITYHLLHGIYRVFEESTMFWLSVFEMHYGYKMANDTIKVDIKEGNFVYTSLQIK